MKYRIRESTIEDGDVLVSIWRSSVADTHSFVSPADLSAIDLEVQRLLPGTPALLALDGAGRPVGFMGLANNRIESLFVAGAQRGRGAGRALIEHAMRRSPSLRTIVNEQNDEALGFYRHLGFVIIGRSSKDEQGRPYPVLYMKWRS